MRVLIVGCGLVGKELARGLRDDGHTVVGTTTTPGKVAVLREVCAEVVVLRGSDAEAVAAAGVGADAIVVTAGPAAAQAMTVEQRERTYHDVLVGTAESVAAVPGRPHLVMLSSLSVYGDAANHLDVIDESAPLTQKYDPSPMKFQQAEATYRAAAADRLAVLRCADIAGGEDPPVMDKLRMAHQLLGGSLPFHDEALFYRVHVLDVVGAIRHALDHRLVGTFNLTHPEVPPRMQPYFDALCALDGLPAMTFRNELLAPTKPVSVDALLATGFVFEHTRVETMPGEGDIAPAGARVQIPRQGRDLALDVLDRLAAALGEGGRLVAEPSLELAALGGPLDGQDVGGVEVSSREDGTSLVHASLAIDTFGVDSHQVHGFTGATSLVPHLFLDVAVSPSTDGTFHVGVDLLPKVDLATSIAYSEAVYDRLTEVRAAALAAPGVLPVPALGPWHWSVHSPWMIAAIVSPEALHRLVPVVHAYVDQWLALLAGGIPDEVVEDVAWQDVAGRDRRVRRSMLSPRTNPAWPLLERLVGASTTAAVRDVLLGEPATRS